MRDAGLLERLVDQVGGEVERAGAGVVDVDVGGALGEDGAAEVGDGDAHVVVAEVDADDARRRGGRA